MKPYKILAIIPARAGSVGIKNKNLQQILGKSLVAWTVEAAKGSRFDLRIVVSTDGREIAEEAIGCGAEVVMRPPAISDGLAKSEDALLHVLDELHREEGFSPEITVFLQCTSPLTSPEDIDGTIDALLNDGADSALAVTPSHYFLWKQRPDGTWDGVNHDKLTRPMRQQREPEFLETGAVYAMNTEGFRKSKHRFFGKTAVYVMPPERRLEIDDWSDLSLARIIMEKRSRTVGKKRPLPATPSALVLDFDGVLTDDRVIVDQHGTEAVLCHRGDGLGISRLRETGFPILILSKETNPVVQARATKLRIPYLQGIDDKAPALSEWASENQLDLSQIIYIGNDINDLPVFPLVGCAAVADAHPEVLASADLILKHPGGRGAVREMTERIIQLTTKPTTA